MISQDRRRGSGHDIVRRYNNGNDIALMVETKIDSERIIFKQGCAAARRKNGAR